ncbi:hypothetical protein FQR65_LT03840 [Abscondita terminalis]|nr:hypothetical protein FQR65_LT03840 [Abscondita terminalis]
MSTRSARILKAALAINTDDSSSSFSEADVLVSDLHPYTSYEFMVSAKGTLQHESLTLEKPVSVNSFEQLCQSQDLVSNNTVLSNENVLLIHPVESIPFDNEITEGNSLKYNLLEDSEPFNFAQLSGFHNKYRTYFDIMIDLTNSIKSYDGEDGGTRAREWVSNLSIMQQLHNWSDSFRSETVESHLICCAAYWYILRKSLRRCTRGFKRTCVEGSVGGVKLTMKWQLMVGRVQKKKESLNSYFFDKVKFCKKFKKLKQQVLVGLWSKTSLMATKHYNLYHQFNNFKNTSN